VGRRLTSGSTNGSPRFPDPASPNPGESMISIARTTNCNVTR